MPIRFHKSLRILPGIKLNISKTGPSISLGRRGMSVNLGRKGSRATVGVPGTGVSYSKYRSHGDATPLKEKNTLNSVLSILWVILIVAMIAFAFYKAWLA
jgi:hypothetical protein